jgi:hypothetical protein
MALAAGERTSNEVRAIASWKLEQLKNWVTIQSRLTTDENHRAFLFYALGQIKRFQDDPKKMNLTPAQAPPDGQPIGMQSQMDGEGRELISAESVLFTFFCGQ